jgi:tetratricopeptide (TPR) repeat protein
MKVAISLCLALSLMILSCKTTQTMNRPTNLTPPQLNQKAVELWRDGKYTDPKLALEYVTEAIEKDPKYGRAYYTRGFIYNDLKRYQESIDSFSEALKYDPHIHETYNGRCCVYFTIEKYEEAIKDYTKAIQIKNDYKLALNNRAMAYLKTGQNQKACIDFKKVCDLGDCGNLKHAKKIGKCE